MDCKTEMRGTRQLPPLELQKRAAVKAAMQAAGLSVSRWARQHGFSPALVAGVLSGRFAGNFGEAHAICVALKLKEAAAFDPAQAVAGFKDAA